MNRILTVSATGLALLLGMNGATLLPLSSSTTAHAQSKKKPARPAAKKPPAARPAGGPVVLGTKQMPGDFGKIGTTYTIGTVTPLNFTLKSAEYSVVPINLGGSGYVPTPDEKFLILRYTVQNPKNREVGYSWTGLGFTAVDAKDVSHEGVGGISREGDAAKLDVYLKPAQKIDVWTALRVPADVVVPKLIVDRGQGGSVIRYDLRGKVKPLPAPYADTADTSGAMAMKTITGVVGAYHPLGFYDAKLESVSYVSGPVAGSSPGDGKRFVSAVFTIRNRSEMVRGYSWTGFDSFVRDADGEKADAESKMLKGSRDETADGMLKPGEEARIRFLYILPQNVEAKTLSIAEPNRGRPVLFEVAGALKP